MLNLYKNTSGGYFNNEQDAVMIDSDALIEEKLKAYIEPEPVPEPDEPVSEEEAQFLEGVEALVRDEEPEEEPEDILEEAKLQAQEILDSAQAQADSILDTARAEAVEIRDEARQEGFNHGLADAQEEVRTEQEEFNSRMKAREDELNIREAGMERDLVDKIITVIDNIFHSALIDKKSMILALVSDAMSGIDGARHFTIKVSPDNLAFVESVRDSLIKKVGNGVTIESVSDSSLDDTQCILETDTGVFDCSPFRQMENLMAYLKLLSMQ